MRQAADYPKIAIVLIVGNIGTGGEIVHTLACLSLENRLLEQWYPLEAQIMVEYIYKVGEQVTSKAVEVEEFQMEVEVMQNVEGRLILLMIRLSFMLFQARMSRRHLITCIVLVCYHMANVLFDFDSTYSYVFMRFSYFKIVCDVLDALFVFLPPLRVNRTHLRLLCLPYFLSWILDGLIL